MMSERSNPGTDSTDLELHALIVDLESVRALPRPVLEFLTRFAEASDTSGPFGLRDFMDQIWPDGLMTTVYASNVGRNPDDPEHFLHLLLRPVCEGPRALHPAVGAMTLGLEVHRKGGRLVVGHVELTPHVPRRSFETRVVAPIHWLAPELYMDREDFETLRQLPFYRAATCTRLEQWQQYLEWRTRLIESTQLEIPYSAWKWESETTLAFVVGGDDLPEPLVGTELEAVPPPPQGGREQPGRRGRPRPPRATRLGPVEEVTPIEPSRDRPERDARPTRPHRVCIRVSEDVAKRLATSGPPGQGQLQTNITGDLAPVNNQRSGIQRLANGHGFCSRLADFIFDSAAAGVPLEVPSLPAIDGGRELNPGQRDAVAKALAAPDLCLVQGPPGTGKTTVIADICLRATRDGKRVLIASQTNLAVDNALARLAGVPWIRPLRLGHPDRVDEEFRDLLADRVVDRWFATIAEHCHQRMNDAQQEQAELEAREREVSSMRGQLDEHAKATELAQRTQQELAEQRRTLERHVEAHEHARERMVALERRVERLQALLRWATSEAALPPDATEEPWPGELSTLPERPHGEPAAVVLDRERARLEPLLEMERAVEAAHAGASVADEAAAEELRGLRRDKVLLVDSDQDEDMGTLRRINRRIKELERGGWNERTGTLDRTARRAWPDRRPECIDQVVDSLAPSPTTSALLRRCGEVVEQHVQVARKANRLVTQTEEIWRARLHDTRARGREANDEVSRARRARDETKASVEAIQADDASARAATHAAQRAWDGAWRQLRPGTEPEPATPEALAGLQRELREERLLHGDRLERAKRWRAVQAEWIARLASPTDSDRDHLQALYVRRSNVVGMTCNEAGKRQTWQDASFQPFDLVIVDEVSKTTPTELILPLLLGEKAILVGDHRQLPPMFRERDASFGEAAELGEVSREDLERFRTMVTTGLFEQLFERAPESIKATLWTQYRMHPQIMGAVNEFYEGKLDAGLGPERLDAARAHHLSVDAEGGGQLISPNHHLLWIDSSTRPDGQPAWEEQAGSSKANELEVELVVELLLRLGRALAERGYGPTTTVEVRKADPAPTWAEAVRQACPELAEATVEDLFAQRRVRFGGRVPKPDEAAAPGTSVEVRAQKEVGVITFYGAQLRRLRQAIERSRAAHPDVMSTMEIRTNTVDRFQGMEKPIVVVSLVRASRGRLGAFVREFQRINVALSRAQQLLAIVGAETTWSRAEVPLPPLAGGEPTMVPIYRNIMELARREGGRRRARRVLLP